MRVIEILNAYPGETFIQEHARAIVAHVPSVKLNWAFTQSSKCGVIVPPPILGLEQSIGLINRNRLSQQKKIIHLIQYLGVTNSYSLRFKNQILKVKPDLIHFHFAATAVRYFNEIRDLGIPFTVSLRGSDIQVEPVVKGESYINKLNQVIDAAKGVHAVTNDLKELLFKYCLKSEKVTVIRTCIEKKWFNINRSPQKKMLVATGRLHWRKGFSDLLMACSILKKARQNFQLIIIGEGPERSMLEYMIRDLGLSEQVQLVGKKNHLEMTSYFERAAFFVLSSLQEGFPNVVAEAMAAKIPVISTDCGGVEEIVQHRNNGFIAKTGNPADLAEKILLAMRTSDTDINAIVNNACQVARKNFSADQHAKEFAKFWNEAILK